MVLASLILVPSIECAETLYRYFVMRMGLRVQGQRKLMIGGDDVGECAGDCLVALGRQVYSPPSSLPRDLPRCSETMHHLPVSNASKDTVSRGLFALLEGETQTYGQ